LLLDMNLSPDWVEVFERAGFEAKHWSQVGEGSAPDLEILDWARKNGFVVFTHDLDFSRLLALTGRDGPSIIQLRKHGILPVDAAADMIAALLQHQLELEEGAIVVLVAETARVRLLPIRDRP
jgi:predicted nuclease of predicted toxin-antitoxin system